MIDNTQTHMLPPAVRRSFPDALNNTKNRFIFPQSSISSPRVQRSPWKPPPKQEEPQSPKLTRMVCARRLLKPDVLQHSKVLLDAFQCLQAVDRLDALQQARSGHWHRCLAAATHDAVLATPAQQSDSIFPPRSLITFQNILWHLFRRCHSTRPRISRNLEKVPRKF